MAAGVQRRKTEEVSGRAETVFTDLVLKKILRASRIVDLPASFLPVMPVNPSSNDMEVVSLLPLKFLILLP